MGYATILPAKSGENIKAQIGRLFKRNGVKQRLSSKQQPREREIPARAVRLFLETSHRAIFDGVENPATTGVRNVVSTNGGCWSPRTVHSQHR